MDTVNKEKAIRAIVSSFVEAYASAFSDRHLSEVDDEEGTINMKIHNVFIALLGKDIQYYSKYSYPFGKTLNMILEELALTLEELIFCGQKHVHTIKGDSVKQEDCINYWNSICDDKYGYDIVLDELDKNLPFRFSA